MSDKQLSRKISYVESSAPQILTERSEEDSLMKQTIEDLEAQIEHEEQLENDAGIGKTTLIKQHRVESGKPKTSII